MVCSAFTKTITGNIILFANSNPIDSVGKIRFYKDNASGSFVKKEYRWSFNKNYWSSWTLLNQENLNSLVTGSNKYLYLEVQYVSAGTGTVSTFSIDYSANTSPVYVPPVPDANIDHEHSLPDGCGEPGGTVKTYEVISVTNAQTLCGKDCEYYLWRPNQKGEQAINTIAGLQKALNNLMGGIQAKPSFVYIDGSLAARDASITWVYNNRQPLGDYIIDPSLSNDFYWYNGFLKVDVSVVAGGVTQAYVDGSLAMRDASITNLYLKDAQQKIYIDGSLAMRDASITWLYANKQPLGPYVRDTSAGNGLYWNNGYLDVSIVTAEGYLKEASIGTTFMWNNGFLNVFIFDVVNGGTNWSSDSDIFNGGFGWNVIQPNDIDGGTWVSQSEEIDGGNW